MVYSIKSAILLATVAANQSVGGLHRPSVPVRLFMQIIFILLFLHPSSSL